MSWRRFFPLAFLLVSARVQALPSPEWVFRVLRSEHFEVIYRADQKALAERYIVAAEKARELLMPIFKEGPDNTVIYISDDTDSSNGEATFLPYPMITVYPVLPSTLDSIDDYGDWPLEMLVHEYTHILNMYPAHGFYVPLKWIFGGVVRPNAVLPKWYLEGLAVNLESRLSDHGRLRADETRASARALVSEGKLHQETLPSINEQELSTWPYGGRPYLYGGWWWDNVQGENSASVIETWNQNFARRLPFFINGPIREKTTKSAEDLLADSSNAVEKQALAELQILKQPHQSRAFADEKGEQSVFAISPSGMKLVYFVSRPSLGTEVKLKTRDRLDQPLSEIRGQRLFKTVGALRVRWLDDNRFIFDAIDSRRPRLNYRDLFIYDLAQAKLRRITEGLRAEEPALSQDGEQLVFIENDGGQNHLALLPLLGPHDKAAVKILVDSGLDQRLSGPEFLNANELLYILREKSGVEQIYDYVFSEQKAHLWNSTLKSAQNLRKTEQGILVSDSGTHVRNIYSLASAEAPPIARTNTLTHIETADFDRGRGELLFSELTADGAKLRSIPIAQFQPAVLPASTLPAPPIAQTQSVETKDENFQPFSYLRPRYWIPFIYTLENNGLLFQGSTSNSDPTGRNSYSAAGSYDTLTKQPSYGLTYVNSSLPTDIGVSYAKSVAFLGASSLVLDSQAATLNFSQYWPFDNRALKWNVGGIWSETQEFGDYRRIGPQVGLIYDHLQSPLNTWTGSLAEISQQQFLQEGNFIAYGRTYVHLAEVLQLGGGNKIFVQARGAFAPNLPFRDILELGDRSLGANYLINLANSDFLLRGYPSGTFIGRKMLNANFEYSFPLVELARGWGSFPVFVKAMEVALFADAMSVDGAGFRSDVPGYYRTGLDTYFMGTGAELRFSTTAGYHLPLNFTLGAYYGLNQRFDGGFTPFVGLGLGDLGALQDKTP